MTAMSKTIEIAETTDQQAGFVLIPLHKLAISQRNIRRTDRKTDPEAVAASIPRSNRLAAGPVRDTAGRAAVRTHRTRDQRESIDIGDHQPPDLLGDTST